MFDPEDVVFVWAIGKSLLVVILSVGVLVYLAWVATPKNEIAKRAEIAENVAMSSTAVTANKMPLIGPGKTEAPEEARDVLSGTAAGKNDTRKSEQPAAAA